MIRIRVKNLLFSGVCLSIALAGLPGCTSNKGTPNEADSLKQYVADRLPIYEEVKLTTDLSKLTENEREVLPYLIEAARVMDELFWLQAYPARDSLLNAVNDEKTKAFIKINYGPWDRLNADKPFLEGIGPKPKGAYFYPADMSRQELERSAIENKLDLYSLIKRDAGGQLVSIPYSIAFKEQLTRAAALLRKGAIITENKELKNYLNLRADALLSDSYRASDAAWLDMTTNTLDIIIGPIENYEDKLFNARASFESYVLVKDKEWSKRLERYVAMLPELQRNLPVEARYKSEVPGVESQLNAYDVVYYAGDCNAGSKTIAVNLPNDERLQQEKGTRRSQLKNAMRAKFDKILMPISDVLIDPSQRALINFDAFFSNVMFHEVAHGLGIKKTLTGKGYVREALQEQYSWLEEAKADVLGLYMVTWLLDNGELQGEKEAYFTTFMAGLLRSVRFGATSAHGKANMLEFNYFREKGAFQKTEAGHYSVDYPKFESAMRDLGGLILKLQGDGDKAAVADLQKTHALVHDTLKADLQKLIQEKIPVDIVFQQGIDVLGLE